MEKLAARKAAANALEQPKYRDRASERRILFNQPDAPVPEKDAGSTKKRHVETPSRPVTPPLPVNPGKDQSNVGNKLLKMMGWKEGTGLGSDGDGRVDPMFVYEYFSLAWNSSLSFSETAIYAQGVGLGASKGKELGKYTEGFSNYVHMVQDAVCAVYSSVLIADSLELLGTGTIWKLIRLCSYLLCFGCNNDMFSLRLTWII